jgi:hypothetical protein
MRVMRLVGRTLLALLGVGCQQSAAESSPFTTAPVMTSAPDASAESSTGGAGASTGSSTTGVELSTGSDGGSASTGTSSMGAVSTFDVGAMDDFGSGKPAGCGGKIDFLFVISRYGGMEGFQAQLLDAFPKFIDTIEAKFADFDYHIMVVDSDPGWGLSTCDEQCPMSCDVVPGYPCDYTPTVCDLTIGAGTVYPAGGKAANKMCNIDGGRRYMTKGQTDLKGTFACAAQVGISGRPWMGEALAAAVHPDINGPGGCNEGFLRDDALLMVTQIANTYDYPDKPIGSAGTPETWAAAVLAAKHDDPDAVVMLSILRAYPECAEPDRTCEMVKMFPHHLLFDRDAPDYGPAFDQATDLVAEACAGFVPPG